MLTVTDLEDLGYDFDTTSTPGCCIVTRDGDFVLQNGDADCPIFHTARLLAAAEGDDELPFAEITADLVKQVSGETWTPPADPSPPVASSDHVDEAAATIRNASLAVLKLPPEDVQPILDKLLGEAKAAIPWYEAFGQPDDWSAQAFAAFQALPQSTKDKILMNLCRMAALTIRYLSGDLPTA